MTIVPLLVTLVTVVISQAQRTLIDYNFTSTGTILNAVDGARQNVAGDVSLVLGPGQTKLGYYPNALDFGSMGRIENHSYMWESQNFIATVIFGVNNEIEGRQNMFESFPFLLSVIKTANQGEFTFLPGVCFKEYGWQGTTTGVINGQDWHTVDLLYGDGVLSVNVNGSESGRRTFDRKELNPQSLYLEFVIATWGGTICHFYGQIAAVQLVDRMSIGTPRTTYDTSPTSMQSTISTLTGFPTPTQRTRCVFFWPQLHLIDVMCRTNVGSIVGAVVGGIFGAMIVCFLLLFLKKAIARCNQGGYQAPVDSGKAEVTNEHLQPQPTMEGGCRTHPHVLRDFLNFSRTSQGVLRNFSGTSQELCTQS